MFEKVSKKSCGTIDELFPLLKIKDCTIILFQGSFQHVPTRGCTFNLCNFMFVSFVIFFFYHEGYSNVILHEIFLVLK